MKTLIGVVVLAFAGLLLVGIVPRIRESRELAAEGNAAHVAPSVSVVMVHRGAPTTDLLLPGTLEALHEASIYARTTGYVKTWSSDIGSHVRAGQVLAEIEAPELDQQIEQARAGLGQLRADSTLAKANLDRWQSLFTTDVVTKEELETHQAVYDDARANLGAGVANYRRLRELQRYEHVTAPFAGVVTSRGLDVGMLVSDGATMGAGGAASARPLFSVAGTDTVRIYVNVPEDVLPLVHQGVEADVLVQGVPGRVFHGTVTRTAGALDAASRTQLTEVQVANPGGALLPGMYAQVRFLVQREHPPVTIPANTLVMRAEGPQVMIVAPDHTVHYQKVELGRDFGNTIEVTSGLADSATVVVNPSDDLHDGLTVRVLPTVTETPAH
jgi:RND family efflux transporter MFP subunit